MASVIRFSSQVVMKPIVRALALYMSHIILVHQKLHSNPTIIVPAALVNLKFIISAKKNLYPHRQQKQIVGFCWKSWEWVGMRATFALLTPHSNSRASSLAIFVSQFLAFSLPHLLVCVFLYPSHLMCLSWLYRVLRCVCGSAECDSVEWGSAGCGSAECGSVSVAMQSVAMQSVAMQSVAV